MVELIAAGKNMTMRVDGGATRTIINDGDHQFMELEEPLYLGGLPASVRDSAKKKYHVRNTDSFNGKNTVEYRPCVLDKRYIGLIALLNRSCCI